jgi:hypothetical protein
LEDVLVSVSPVSLAALAVSDVLTVSDALTVSVAVDVADVVAVAAAADADDNSKNRIYEEISLINRVPLQEFGRGFLFSKRHKGQIDLHTMIMTALKQVEVSKG